MRKVEMVQKWNWDYKEALDFQMKCVERVQQNPELEIWIFCSHPHCFTMGRGLQKNVENLIPCPPDLSVPFPLYQIKRGGGLTFHYPGQWIVYPIVNLNNRHWTLKTLVDWLLESVKNELTGLDPDFGLDLKMKRHPLGLWHKDKKIASLGIEIQHFVTLHGLALNFYEDKQMFEALKMVNPCGLKGDIYSSVREIRKVPADFWDQVHYRIFR